MCAGTREDGTEIVANDPIWDALQSVAQAARERPEAWLEQDRLYGDLAQTEAFRDAFVAWLTLIWDEGAVAAMNAYTQVDQSNGRASKAG